MPHEKDNYLSPPASPLNPGFNNSFEAPPLPSPALSFQSGDDFTTAGGYYSSLPVHGDHAPDNNSYDNDNYEQYTTGADNLTRPISYDSPASPGFKVSGSKKSTKDKAFFKEVFSVRDTPVIPKAAAGIWVEFKTNVTLRNPQTFLYAFTTHLSHRYKLPPTSILLSLSPGAFLSLGGTSDPCYSLAISSVHSISPTVNKRQAIMIQAWLHENLGISPQRGVVKFQLVQCADWVSGCETVQGRMEREESVRMGRVGSRRGSAREKDGKRERRKREETIGEEQEGELKELEEGLEKMGMDSQETLADEMQGTKKKRNDKPKRKKSVFDIFSRGQK
ncbi:hypothetical protein BZA77DRAFT_109201 [Pyronema omphalodes]|nr:hypothetical protein BZA77DRAFT_109201 [Pyronema omphalodes]